MEKLKITMKAEVELSIPNTASVAERKAAIQALRETILPALAGHTHGGGVNMIGVRVTGDSTNAVRA